ncbi:MAG: SWIM zinc finger family protein, partial [Deltaproteobacteria bacterium]
MSYYEWAPYVPVAVRRAKAQKQLEKMKKKGFKVQPVQLAGRKIADSFWGKGWCDHMESFSDYANRLPRGRSYVRNGSVCHLEIKPGRVEAIVSGSSLYNVSVTISTLVKQKWDAVKSICTGRIGSLIDLLRGKLDRGVMEVVSDRKDGLFPLPGEMKFDCDCPDWAGMCKHVAAVLYGVGARLDHSPEMLFLLRGVNHEELIDVSAAVTGVTKSGTSRRRIATTGLADVFGVDMAE